MSSNRYSALNRRPAATSSLFESYPGNASSRPSSSTAQGRPGGNSTPGTYGNYSSSPRPSSPYNAAGTPAGGVSPYGHTNGSSSPYASANGNANATDSYSSKDKPPKHFSSSVLDALESQNDNAQTSLLSSKVAQLKTLTIAIGDEIRDSSTLAGQINDQFEGAGTRLKGTMKRMLRMAEKTGVGWRVWLLFFAAVWALFVYVWLF